ncbi:MAG: o-succinylbenzoate synthase, partial [Opitutae bacterium]|nr:o-succinylbenzoate synthase [Opitutae bacterium]
MVYRFSHKSYRLPLRASLRTAHGLWREREGHVVRLEDEAGRAGYGEIAPLPWFGTETREEAEEICRKFGERVEAALLDEVPERFGCVRFALACARSEVERGLRTRSPDPATGETRPEAALHQRSARLPV